jgi:hypothetical protein
MPRPSRPFWNPGVCSAQLGVGGGELAPELRVVASGALASSGTLAAAMASQDVVRRLRDAECHAGDHRELIDYCDDFAFDDVSADSDLDVCTGGWCSWLR